MQNMNKYAIGCDIGGSHISCTTINLNKEKVLEGSYITLKVDNQASSSNILSQWVAALNISLATIKKEELAGIGFAMPGPFEYDKGIARFTHEVAKYESLNGLHIGKLIKEMLELKPTQEVRFMNDATAFAVGEAWMGKAAGYDRSLSITLGTGFGSAFIDNGVPVVERNDVPKLGCVWHLPYKDGIADDYFSTRWFIKRFAEKSGLQMAGVKEIADCIKTNPYAANVFEEFGDNLGEFIGPWLLKFKTEILVIGGNISSAYIYIGPSFEKSLQKQGITTSIRISELKENAALIGSARLFDKEFWRQVQPLLPKM
jgi:glucokinase